MQHGSAPAALVVWAAEAIPTPVPMRDRAHHHRSDAAGADRAVDARDRSAARGPQDPALRGQAARRRMPSWSARPCSRSRPQALTLPPEVAELPVDLPGPDQARAGAAGFFRQPFCRRAFPCARPAAALACPVPARSGTGSTGRWSRGRRFRRRCARWSPRISATAPPPCWISGNGPSSMPTSPSAWPGRRSARGSCSMRNPGSAPTAPVSPWRGWPTSAAISAARCKAS